MRSLLGPFAAAQLGLLALACGGGGPSKAEEEAARNATPSSWRATVVETAPINEPPRQHLQVAFAGGELPDATRLEDAVALQSVVASVGTSGDGIEFEVGRARCVARKGVTLAKEIRPDPRIQPELDAAGLDAAEGALLAQADGTADIECTGPLLEAPSLACAVAIALARTTSGFIYDPQTDRFWSSDKLKAASTGDRFAIGRSVKVVMGREQNGHWLATQGMVALGRPDLFVGPVDPDRVEPMKAQMLFIADAVARGDHMGSGTRLEIGSAVALMVPLESYQASLPEGTPGKAAKIEGPTHARMALVDPTGKPGDIEPIRRMVNRLTVQ